MENKFTSNDIIRDLYGETSYLEKLSIEKELQDNFAFAESYEELEQAKEGLVSVEMQAPSSVIQNILTYSRNSKLENELG